jgi:hypothetical protein
MLNCRRDPGYEQRMEPQAGEAEAAEARKRQAEGFERLDQTALLSGRVQLDPTPTNRARFRFFLSLLEQSRLAGPEP